MNRWLRRVGVVVALLVAAACGVDRRSDELLCSAGCLASEQCVNGYCVVVGVEDAAVILDGAVADGDGVVADAAIDGASCPPPCTSCDLVLGWCTVDCLSSPGLCDGTVTCPAGLDCNVACSKPNECSQVQCPEAPWTCAVQCSGNNTCGSVMCGSGPCNVSCDGQNSCDSVSCGASCACDVACLGAQACGAGVACTQAGCSAGEGCDAEAPGCDTCGP
jgi:hypothetical protein